jgi:predicted phage terminase large subunit-like protein
VRRASHFQRTVKRLRRRCIVRHLEYGEVLREVFGDFVSDDKWDVRELNVRPRKTRAKESTISCVGVGGPVVSRHYDCILADDLIDEENSRTEGQRQKVHDWFWRSLMPTLEPHGRIHVLGTRYHFADLYGVLIEGDFAACHQVVKALPEDGDTPWPEKFSVEWLEDRRRSMGTLLFNSQYQNDVEAMKGRLFKAEWLRYFDVVPEGLRIYQGVDLAISQKETADYFAHVTVGVDAQKNVYVLVAIQRRMTFKAQTDFIIERQRQWRPIKLLVEAVAYQAAQVDELRRAGVYAIPVKTTKDKVTRFLRLAARFEAGMVFLRRGMQDELLEQLLMAPEGRHDDLVDALEFAVSAEWGLYQPEPSSYEDALLDMVDKRHFRPWYYDRGEPWIDPVAQARDER